MITVLFAKAACVSLWRVPKLQAVIARDFKTPDGAALRKAGRRKRSFLSTCW